MDITTDQANGPSSLGHWPLSNSMLPSHIQSGDERNRRRRPPAISGGCNDTHRFNASTFTLCPRTDESVISQIQLNEKLSIHSLKN